MTQPIGERVASLETSVNAFEAEKYVRGLIA